MAKKKNTEQCGTQMLLPVSIVTAIIVVLVVMFIAIDECQRYGYSIPQFSHPRWRKHVEGGWLATEIVMIIDYIAVLISSSLLAISIAKSWGYYHSVVVCRSWVVIMILTLIFELGCGLYQYSWYAMIIFRRGVVGFYCLFWFLRFCFFIFAVVCGFGRLRELQLQKRFGVKPRLTGPSGLPAGYSMHSMEHSIEPVGTTSRENLVRSKEHVAASVQHAYEHKSYDNYGEKSGDLGPECGQEKPYDERYGYKDQPPYEDQPAYQDQGYADQGYRDAGYAEEGYAHDQSYPSDHGSYGQDYGADPRDVNMGYAHQSSA